MQHYIITVPSLLTPETYSKLSVQDRDLLSAAFKDARIAFRTVLRDVTKDDDRTELFIVEKTQPLDVPGQ